MSTDERRSPAESGNATTSATGDASERESGREREDGRECPIDPATLRGVRRLSRGPVMDRQHCMGECGHWASYRVDSTVTVGPRYLCRACLVADDLDGDCSTKTQTQM